MPGVNGVRVPLRRFFDPSGRWGYLIDNCRHNNVNGLHVLYNFVLFPDAFAGRDKGGTGLSDMGVLMERNHEDNLAWVREHGQKTYRCWSELEGKYEGETLVIASCGPSLTESLPTLYKKRDKYTLLCLNRSLRAFTDPAVKPDFYYFVERRGIPDWVHEVSQSGAPISPFDVSDITLIATPQCDPRIVRRFDHDKTYWGYTELGALAHLPDVAKLKKYDVKAATTIGNAPFIAWKLGFKRIVLVGCDFSMDCQLKYDDPKEPEKGQVVATRNYFDKDWQNTHYSNDPNWIRRALPVIGIRNRCVMVEPNLVGHRTYMEAVLDYLHFDAKVECINASPRGTLYFNVQDLDEVL